MPILSMSIALMLSQAAASAPPPADAAKMKCKSEQSLGSRVRKRVCHTEAEWAEIEKAARNAFNNGQNVTLNDSRGYQ